MVLSEAKSIFKSMTFYGGMISSLPAIMSAFNEVFKSGELQAHYAAIIGAIGGIMAIIGRLRAKLKVVF